LSDINLYTWDGVDSDGLDIYTRRRGSNRAELYHRFFSLAFGPATMGPEMGHYLMLLVSYRFNISTGIARCNEYDFGHPWLEYIDRIQIRHIQLFGWNLFPRHKNLLLVETDPDFIVVGFGSISLDDRYVQPSDTPAHDLKAGIRWLASQMRVAEPALNVSSPFERKICNDFFKTFPKPTTRRFEELGKRFKEKTDGIRVFPKIASQLRHYYKRWRTNNAIRFVQDSIRQPYQLFLDSLAKLPELTGNLLAFSQSTTQELAEELANLEKENSQQELAIPADMNHPHSVPPASTVTQSPYVLTAATGKPWGARKNANVCYYYPECKSLECGGGKDGMQMCKFVRSGSIVIPVI
jgi:hypothetical protein